MLEDEDVSYYSGTVDSVHWRALLYAHVMSSQAACCLDIKEAFSQTDDIEGAQKIALRLPSA